jgi:hypothetical protein
VNNDTSDTLVTLALAGAILFVLAVILATPAVPADVCLSKKEARHLWPRSHLYWYSRDHCWSNRRGPPRGIRMDPVVNSHAQAKEVVPDARRSADTNKKSPRVSGGITTVRPDEFNAIDAMADADTFFEAKPFELWRSVVVVDPYVFADLWEQRIGDQWPNK